MSNELLNNFDRLSIPLTFDEAVEKWPELVEHFTNGCGSKVKLPTGKFSTPCNRHDWGFLLGGDWEQWKKVNRTFRKDVYRTSKTLNWFDRARYSTRAFVYSMGVNLGSKAYWNYRAKPATMLEIVLRYESETGKNFVYDKETSK